jgi:hypothetical protein
MTNYNGFFAFGPSHSFVAYLPKVNANSCNFSPNLEDVITGDHIKSLNFVAFVGDQNDGDASTKGKISQAYVGYHKHGFMGAGHLYYPPDQPSMGPSLEGWIKQQDDKTEGMQVVYNGKGGYWARSRLGNCHWHHLSAETGQWLKSGNPHGSRINVALGINDSYIIQYEDGHVTWDLKGSYNTLDRRLEQVLGQSTQLLYASLNPYQGEEYFCIFNDSSCAFKFPSTDAFQEVEKALHHHSDLRVIIDSPTLKHSANIIPKPSKTEKEDSANLPEKIIEATAEGAAVDVAKKGLVKGIEAVVEVAEVL